MDAAGCLAWREARRLTCLALLAVQHALPGGALGVQSLHLQPCPVDLRRQSSRRRAAASAGGWLMQASGVYIGTQQQGANAGARQLVQQSASRRGLRAGARAAAGSCQQATRLLAQLGDAVGQAAYLHLTLLQAGGRGKGSSAGWSAADRLNVARGIHTWQHKWDMLSLLWHIRQYSKYPHGCTAAGPRQTRGPPSAATPAAPAA